MHFSFVVMFTIAIYVFVCLYVTCIEFIYLKYTMIIIMASKVDKTYAVLSSMLKLTSIDWALINPGPRPWTPIRTQGSHGYFKQPVIR